MRAVAIVLTVLCVVFAGLWVLGYGYVMAMACAFSTGGNCRSTMPWQLTGDDLQFLVLAPGAGFAALLGLTIWAWRRAGRAGL